MMSHTSRTRLYRGVLNLTVLALCLSGCKAGQTVPPPKPGQGPQAEQAPKPLGLLGEAVPLQGEVLLSTLVELKPRQAKYLILQGPMKGKTLQSTLTPPEPAGGDAADNPWQLTLESVRTVFLQLSAQGTLLIPGEQDQSDRVFVSYEPAVGFIPAVLRMGRVTQGTSEMTIASLRTGEVRDTGRCDWHTDVLGQQRVRTPLGEFDAILIRGVRDVKLGLATVHVAVDEAYVPGVGLVWERIDRNVRILGLLPARQVEERVLVER